jgi:hypothetical protein
MPIEFGKFTIGALPTGFSTGLTGRGKAVAWTVVEDPSAPSGCVLAEISADTTDYRFPLAIYDDQRLTNVAVAVHFKPVAGKVDRAAGIAVRLLDQDNYYVVRANALEGNVRVYCVVKGEPHQNEGVSRKIASIYGKSDCVQKATSLRLRSRGRSCSRQPTEHSPGPALSRFGPRLIASPISIRW